MWLLGISQGGLSRTHVARARYRRGSSANRFFRFAIAPALYVVLYDALFHRRSDRNSSPLWRILRPGPLQVWRRCRSLAESPAEPFRLLPADATDHPRPWSVLAVFQPTRSSAARAVPRGRWRHSRPLCRAIPGTGERPAGHPRLQSGGDARLLGRSSRGLE